MKQRLSDYTKIKGKQLDKIKFALVSPNSKAEYIDDGKLHSMRIQNTANTPIDEIVLATMLEGRDNISLGLDHTNKSRSFWGKSDSIFIR
jgi:ubiquitin carboxyl-terminal hydrolase 7